MSSPLFSEKVEFRLSRPFTQHPTIYFTIPNSFLSTPSTSISSSCNPYLLLSLPPSIFLDPFSFPPYSSTIPSGINQLHLLGPTELEKPVGWSQCQKDPSDDLANRVSSTDPLHKEYSSVLIKLNTIQQIGNGKVRADGVREVKVKSPWDAELEERKQIEEIQSYGIPLHARYLPAQPHSATKQSYPTLEMNADLLDQVKFHAQNLFRPIEPLWDGLARSASKKGNYKQVQLDVPSFFWACESDGKAWDMLEQIQKVASVDWDLTNSTSILPSTHHHLLPLVSSHLPSHPYPILSLLQPVPPILTGLQVKTLSTRLPAGDSNSQSTVQSITALVILMSAACCMLVTSKSLNRLDKKERVGR